MIRRFYYIDNNAFIRMRLLALAVLACCYVASCHATTINPDQIVELSEGDHGKTLDVPLNTMIVVKLKATLGSGYSWQLTAYDPKVLSVSMSDVAADRTALPGRSDIQRFTLHVISKGSTNMKFKYARQWEKDIAAVKELEFMIVVH